MNPFETAQVLVKAVKAGGGATVDMLDVDLPTYGYYVGGVKPSLVYKSIDDVDPGEVAWFVGMTVGARYFGYWVDQADGKVYFDAVTWFPGIHQATEAGVDRGEIAIWDIENNEEIRLLDVPGADQ